MITVTLGCSASVNTPLGIALLNGVAPVGDLGGADCNPNHVRVGTCCFRYTFSDVQRFAALVRSYFRDPTLRAFVPLCKSEMSHVPKYKNALQFRSAGHR
jgi:hypothetical protein